MPTYVVRSRKSTPMVFLYSSVNAPRQNRRIMDDFPTAPLPTTSTLTSFSNASSICGVRGARVGGGEREPDEVDERGRRARPTSVARTTRGRGARSDASARRAGGVERSLARAPSPPTRAARRAGADCDPGVVKRRAAAKKLDGPSNARRRRAAGLRRRHLRCYDWYRVASTISRGAHSSSAFDAVRVPPRAARTAAMFAPPPPPRGDASGRLLGRLHGLRADAARRGSAPARARRARPRLRERLHPRGAPAPPRRVVRSVRRRRGGAVPPPPALRPVPPALRGTRRTPAVQLRGRGTRRPPRVAPRWPARVRTRRERERFASRPRRRRPPSSPPRGPPPGSPPSGELLRATLGIPPGSVGERDDRDHPGFLDAEDASSPLRGGGGGARTVGASVERRSRRGRDAAGPARRRRASETPARARRSAQRRRQARGGTRRRDPPSEARSAAASPPSTSARSGRRTGGPPAPAAASGDRSARGSARARGSATRRDVARGPRRASVPRRLPRRALGVRDAVRAPPHALRSPAGASRSPRWTPSRTRASASRAGGGGHPTSTTPSRGGGSSSRERRRVATGASRVVPRGYRSASPGRGARAGDALLRAGVRGGAGRGRDRAHGRGVGVEGEPVAVRRQPKGGARGERGSRIVAKVLAAPFAWALAARAIARLRAAEEARRVFRGEGLGGGWGGWAVEVETRERN